MSEVKRYYNWCAASHGHKLMEHETGNLVAYSDYDALRQQVAELRKLAYTYHPSEPFAPDGETLKQRAISDEAKLKKCREALEFYANPEVYRPDFKGQIRCPLQDKAQQTLKDIG